MKCEGAFKLQRLLKKGKSILPEKKEDDPLNDTKQH